MNRIVLRSPAKLNLYLKVRHKRSDGYHELVTVFERVDLFDEISFRATAHQGIRIRCDHKSVPTGPKNLVARAARLLQSEFGLTHGAAVTIKKRIPVAAGLAGGSSNAATALLGLSRVWNLPLSRAKLLSLAGKIGSDVPFFLHDTSWALGTGRGDIIKKLNINTKIWHILVVPCVKMYSGKVYQGLSRVAPGGSRHAKAGRTNLLTKINDNVNILTRNLKKDNILEVSRYLANDLEEEIVRLCPRLMSLKERLKSLNTQGVMISGSGPAVFGLTTTKREAEHIKTILQKRFSQVFVVRTL